MRIFIQRGGKKIKNDKKKKREKRKLRKKKRKVPTVSFEKWLTPELDKQIHSLANRLMRIKMEEISKLPLHHRFICPICNEIYCLNNSGEVSKCKNCYLGENWVNCAKKVEDFRECCKKED